MLGSSRSRSLCASIVAGLIPASSALTWGTTKNLFVFGDSYTTTSWNISAGLTSPAPGYVSSNGLNWVEALTTTYNVGNTKVYNLAYGGATIDSKLVTPYLPTVQSVVTQVGLWKQYLSPPPSAVPWTSDDSLFAIWIGINDIGNSWGWTNVTQAGFHQTLLDRLFGQVDILYQAGARSFLFITVPPLERTPLFIEQGSAAVTQVKASTLDFNKQLGQYVQSFVKTYNNTKVAKVNGPLGQVEIFDSQKVFNGLLDNADAFGYVNITGYAPPYENGTPSEATQVAPYKPVTSFFWLNTLHPLFTVHDILARGISTLLS